MKWRVIQLVFALLFFKAMIAQVGIGTTTPQSVLDVQSTTSGIMIPRMTKLQRDKIVSPKESMTIYQTDDAVGYHFYNGTAWSQIIDSKNVTEHVNTILETSSGAFEQVTESGKKVLEQLVETRSHMIQVTMLLILLHTHTMEIRSFLRLFFAVGDRAEVSGDFSFAMVFYKMQADTMLLLQDRIVMQQESMVLLWDTLPRH